MPIEHKVAQGECLESIAEQYGFSWQRLWNLPENAALRRRRKEPTILLPGDVVVIPEKELRQEDRPTGQRHVFLRKGVPSTLRLQLLDGGKPRSRAPYLIDIDGRTRRGTTDEDGWVVEVISPSARRAVLTLYPELPEEDRIEYELELGHMDPADSVTGIQGRLRNLGFYDGPMDGAASEELRAALLAFQRDQGLPLTGEADPATVATLVACNQS